MASDTLRRPLSGTFDWTYTKSAQTVISAQISANRYYEGSRTVVAAQYKPSDVGLPKYMDTEVRHHRLHHADYFMVRIYDAGTECALGIRHL